MKKLILPVLLIVLSGLHYLACGQDVIEKENGEEIKSKVVEVTNSDIKYKNFEDPEFTTNTISIEDVKKIRYEDGTEKVFKKNLVSHYVSLSGGVASPNGDFGWNNKTKSGSGYAIGGKGRAALDIGVYVAKNFGIGCVFGGTKFDIDTIALKGAYIGLNSYFRFYQPNWKIQYMMFGPLYSFKLGKKFAIDARLLIGPFSAQKPAYDLHYKDINNKDYDYDYQPGHGTGLGIAAGTAIRWHFSKRWGLRLSVDYMGAKPSIKYIAHIFEPGSGTGPIERRENNVLVQKISIMRVGLGLMFLFKR